MSTPFDEQAVDELVNLGVKRLKIAGFESTDWRFVDMVASTGLPLIISLGIGFKEDYLDMINSIITKHKNDVTFLHCNNAYPTPNTDINLNTIPHLAKITNCKIGLSDHTESTMTPSLAVAMGATTIEKHYTLSKRLPGPDHPFALEPHELKQMVDNIKITETMLGNIKGEYSNSELSHAQARRSVVSKSNIKIGDILTVDNITTKRPYLEGNVAASEWFNILGTTSTKDYKPDDFI
jgi:sialic acid synthase SpsE